MAKLPLTRLLASVAGGAALAFTAAAGVASAAPDVGAIVNSTCTYPQVMAALEAQNPAAYTELSQNSLAVGALQGFINAGPEQRLKMVHKYENNPKIQQYLDTVGSVAATCNNY